MAQTTATSLTTERHLNPAPQPRVTPIKWWAGVGAVFAVFTVYVFGSWLISGPQSTPPGPSTIPGWMRISLNVQVWLTLPLGAVFFYFLVIRSCRRAGHLTLDGIMVLAILTVYWQDVLCNIIVPQTFYNSRLPNWGSWNLQIPGWLSPHGDRIAEPGPWVVPMYVVGLAGGAIFGAYVMTRCRSRWPELKNLHLVGICLLVMATIDLVLESGWMRTGLFAYQGVWGPSWLTLNDGKWYQFPLYEPVLLGGLVTAWASIRFFKNDKGQTIVERGLERVNVSGGKKTAVRLLAFIAIFNLTLLVYEGIMTAGSLYLRPWPEDIYTRSYFTNMICGPGTDYACPNGETPWNTRRKPIHFAPDGKVVVPPGAEVPDQTTAGAD